MSTPQTEANKDGAASGLALATGSEMQLPHWIKVQRVFLWGPRHMKDTGRIRWLCHAWQIEDSAWEYFMGLLPEYEYFETESAARADPFPNNEVTHD